MKRLFLASAVLAFGQFTSAQGATPTLLSFISAFGKCPATGPSVILWTGTAFVCPTLGTGLTYNASTNVISAAGTVSTPIWQIETVGFSTLAAGATTLTYTTKQTPIAGVLLYWYSSSNLFTSSWGATAYTGQPITITLPTGWLPTDSVTFVYASQ
jgi:hypothetical protein